VKFFAKKDHLWVAAPRGRRHVAPAATAKAGMGVPPPPKPACGLKAVWWALPRPAASPSAGKLRWRLPPVVLPAPWQVPQVPDSGADSEGCRFVAFFACKEGCRFVAFVTCDDR
jgi:hypothetical protein